MINLYHDDGGDGNDRVTTMLFISDSLYLIISDQELLLPVTTVGNGLLVLVSPVPLSLSYLTIVIIGMVVMMRMPMMLLRLMLSPHG